MFSNVDGTAIASLHFKPSIRDRAKVSPTAKSLLVNIPKLSSNGEHRSQGIMNMEDQEFEFVITNLSTTGMIDFNLMKTKNLSVKQILAVSIRLMNSVAIIRTLFDVIKRIIWQWYSENSSRKTVRASLSLKTNKKDNSMDQVV
jgi:hypothetical protein